MRMHASTAAVVFAAITVSLAIPAFAIDGEILITHAKAMAGGVTPGDAAGYPISISVPGKYKLAGNLPVPAGTNGIEINVPEVTIDFNGFRMHGSYFANYGIVSPNRSTTIRNGTIIGFKFNGITATGNSLMVQDMRIVENGGAGVAADSVPYARFLNNTIAANSGNGILCGYACHVEGNDVSDMQYHGVYIRSGTVLGNTIIGNGKYSAGYYGIYNSGGGSDVGFGNNTLINNNGGQVSGPLIPLHPNSCSPAC
jgi:hypothetical protein